MKHLSAALPSLLLLAQACALGDEPAAAEAPPSPDARPRVELAPVRNAAAREEALLHGVVSLQTHPLPVLDVARLLDAPPLRPFVTERAARAPAQESP